MAAIATEAVRIGVSVPRASSTGGERGEAVVPFDSSVPRWRWKTVLADVVSLLGIVVSVPVAVLLVGTPVALAIVLLLKVVRVTLGAF